MTDAPAAGSLAASGPAVDGRATAGPAAGRAASLRRRLRGRRPPQLLTGPPWRQGLLCNLLNPKIAVLFTSLIPQFVAPGQSAPLQAAILAGIFVAITLVWLTGYALAASAAQQVLRRVVCSARCALSPARRWSASASASPPRPAKAQARASPPGTRFSPVSRLRP